MFTKCFRLFSRTRERMRAGVSKRSFVRPAEGNGKRKSLSLPGGTRSKFYRRRNLGARTALGKYSPEYKSGKALIPAARNKYYRYGWVNTELPKLSCAGEDGDYVAAGQVGQIRCDSRPKCFHLGELL